MEIRLPIERWCHVVGRRPLSLLGGFLSVAAAVLSAPLASAVELKVDFGVSDQVIGGPFHPTTPNHVQPGFFDFSSAQNDWDDDAEISYRPLSGESRTVSGVTVHLGVASSATSLFMTDQFVEMSGSLGDLVEDMAGSVRGDLIITLSDLPAGTYQWTSYHHVPFPEFNWFGRISIVLNTGSGDATVVTNLDPSFSFNPISSATFPLTANGVDNVTLRIHTPVIGPSVVFTNGFTLVPVPEPATVALIASGVVPLGLHTVRRRGRRRR